jgi:hypothetical protein
MADRSRDVPALGGYIAIRRQARWGQPERLADLPGVAGFAAGSFNRGEAVTYGSSRDRMWDAAGPSGGKRREGRRTRVSEGRPERMKAAMPGGAIRHGPKRLA